MRTWVGVPVLLSSLVVAAPATAAVVPATSGGNKVSFSSDAASDTIAVTCGGGQVRANGGPGILPCADLIEIEVYGNGGVDQLDVSAVTRAAFPKLVETELDGGPGADDVTGSPLNDGVTGDGEDTIATGEGDDRIAKGKTVSAGAGNDLLTDVPSGSDAGAGDDRMTAPEGTGPWVGGPGSDELSFSLDAAPAIDLKLALTDDAMRLEAQGGMTDFSIPSVEQIALVMPNGGKQTIDASAFDGSITVDGRDGDDTLIGGGLDDVLRAAPATTRSPAGAAPTCSTPGPATTPSGRGTRDPTG